MLPSLASRLGGRKASAPTPRSAGENVCSMLHARADASVLRAARDGAEVDDDDDVDVVSLVLEVLDVERAD